MTLARRIYGSMWTYLCWKEVLAVLLGVHLLLDELVAHGLVVIHLEGVTTVPKVPLDSLLIH